MNDSSPLVKVCLLVIAVVVGGAGLVYAKSVLIPFAVALLITYILLPLVSYQEAKLKFPRGLAVSSTLVFALALLMGLGVLITTNIAGMAANFEGYVARFSTVQESLTGFLLKLGFDSLELPNFDFMKSLKPALGYVTRFSKALLDLVADSFLIMVFVIFLMSGKQQTFPKTQFFTEADGKIRLYLLTKVATSLVTGIVTGATFGVLGIDLALLFGFLAFCLNFIPTVGSIVAVFIPVPVIVVSASSYSVAVLAFSIPAVVQFLIGNILEPKIMGDNLDLHPVTLLLALMFWGLLWGIPGMLLAAPITVILKVALSGTAKGRIVSELMAGRI